MSTVPARTGAPTAQRFVALLVVVIGVLAVLRWTIEPDVTRRNLEFFPDMATAPTTESQTLSAVLPGGLSHQALVEGVVPRGHYPFRYGVDEEEAKRAGRELASPVSAEEKSDLERGGAVYRIHCITCHGVDGAGAGPAVLRGMLPPPNLAAVNAKEMADGNMFHLLTLGRGNMPSMGARLDPLDRWRVILHVRTLQGEGAK